MDNLGPDSQSAHPLEVFDITYLHFHSILELGVCVSGRGCCIVEGVEYPFEAGDVEIIFPFQKHLSRSEGAECSQWYWLNVNVLQVLGAWGAPDLARLERLLYGGMGLCGIIDREKYPLIAELIRKIVLPGARSPRVSCLCALIETLAQESEQLPHLQLRPARAFLKLEPAIDEVQRALERGECPSVTNMAAACALSPSPFRRAFRLTMGQSPREYVQSCQMLLARRRLLLTDASVTEIALSVGYQDVSGFNRRFLETYGIPPSVYRTNEGMLRLLPTT